MCRSPSTFYEWKDKLPTARQQRDRALLVEIERVHKANFGVYGARKVWLQLNREGIAVARCTVERLMAAAGLAGAIRGKVKRTTIADPAAARPDDLVQRRFAPRSTGTSTAALYEYCGDMPPAGLETIYYDSQPEALQPAELTTR